MKAKTFRFDKKAARQQIEVDTAFAADRLRTHGEVGRQLVMRSGHAPDRLIIMPFGWSDADERAKMMLAIRAVALALNVRMITMLTEAWMREVPRRAGENEAEHEARSMAVRPSEAEDRIEVLTVATFWRDETGKIRSLARIRSIERDAEGAYSGLKPLNNAPEADAAEIDSWLAEVVPPDDVPDEVQALTRRILANMGIEFEEHSITRH